MSHYEEELEYYWNKRGNEEDGTSGEDEESSSPILPSPRGEQDNNLSSEIILKRYFSDPPYKQPRQAILREDAGEEIASSPSEGEGEDEDEGEIASTAVAGKHRLTHTGLAEYVAQVLGDRISYCSHQDQFLLYSDDVGKWIRDGNDHHIRKIIRRILGELPSKMTNDPKTQDRIFYKLEHSSMPSSVARELTLCAPKRSVEEFDADPWLLGVQNGVIELKTGRYRPGRVNDLISRTAAVNYDPQADCPQFEKFIAEIMCGDQDLIDFLHTMVGYLLLGHNPERMVCIMQGRGSNGKTVLLNVLENLLHEYANAIPLATMIKAKNETVGDDIMSLVGYRVLMSRELEKESTLNSGKIKKLTGGDSVSARHLHKNYERVKVTGKFLVATNEIPRIEDNSQGIWSRIRLIPFALSVPEDQQDKELENKLMTEASGILNWAMAGLRKYQASGLVQPAIMRKYKTHLHQDISPVEEFIHTFYEVSDSERITTRPLYQHYQAWASTTHHAQNLSEKAFSILLVSLGIEKTRTKVSLFGLKLKAGDRPIED